jgi:ubiquinone/menaquinone biosynthesis C-methylase UbiE
MVMVTNGSVRRVRAPAGHPARPVNGDEPVQALLADPRRLVGRRSDAVKGTMTQGGASARPVDRVRGFYERYATDYDRWTDQFDRLLLGEGRRRICARARGHVLEVAVGTGRNLAFYPRDARLTGLDLSPAMLAIAGRRAAESGRTADLRLGDAQSLPFADNQFDAVVFTLALSVIPDARRALAEAYRVLRPGGQLLLLEHVRSGIAPVRWLERVLEPLMASLARDHWLRDPRDHLGPIGFRVERCDRTKGGCIEELIARKGEPPAGGPPGIV